MPKAPISVEWHHNETCVALLFEGGFLCVLTLHPAAASTSGGAVTGAVEDEEALSDFPAWASANATASHQQIQSSYPSALEVSSSTYSIDSSRNKGFTPMCLLETADRLLFGGGPAGCLEYMYWNDASIPSSIARGLSQDSAFQHLEAHSVEIEDWGGETSSEQ